MAQEAAAISERILRRTYPALPGWEWPESELNLSRGARSHGCPEPALARQVARKATWRPWGSGSEAEGAAREAISV